MPMCLIESSGIKIMSGEDMDSLVALHNTHCAAFLSFVMDQCRTDLVTRENVYDVTLTSYELHWDFGSITCRMWVAPKNGSKAIGECEVRVLDDTMFLDTSQFSSEYIELISEYCYFGLISFKERMKESMRNMKYEKDERI